MSVLNRLARSITKRGRKSARNSFVTKNGTVIKLHRTLKQRTKSHSDTVSRMRADRLNRMPKGRIKRFFYKFHPKNLYSYWLSREGAIMALKVLGVGSIGSFLIIVGLFAYFRKDLLNLRDPNGSTIGGSIRYYDKTGATLLWEDFDAVKRIPVKEPEISQAMKDATVAIEDKDFFKHGGFDTRAIVRAGWNNAFGGSTQGGSTITQQLVKLTQNWSKERTVTRKIKELILSVELERSYSKQEILTGYLNTAPYGNIQYGVEAAARDYFEKSAKDITVEEAAFLAAIPKSPSFYSPYGPYYNKEALVGRALYILGLMREQGKITDDQYKQAINVDILAKVKSPKAKYAAIKSPWFVLAARDELIKKYGSETVLLGGWRVTTTLDTKLQQIAEEEVTKGIVQVKRQGGDVAAFVAEDVKTGQVVALVGGSDFNNPEYGQNNYAHDYRLPPGSSFKPYDYAAVIENTDKFGAGTVLYDTLGPIPGHYPCTTGPKKGGNCLVDYDFRFPGPMSIRYALGGSRNVPAVKSMLIAGIDKTVETATKLGLKSGYKCFLDDELTQEGPCYASSAIGDGAYLKMDEHVHAFASLSRNGRNIPQTYILKIEDSSNKLIDEWKPTTGEQGVRDETAYIVSDILSDPRASYMTRKFHDYKGHKFSLKTGTTNDAKDGWLMGYSTQYAAGVWVGYHNRRVEMRGFMETMTQPIWGGFMHRVHDELKPEERVRPKGIQVLPAYVVKSHVGVSSIEPSPATDLFPSWYKGAKKSTTGEKRIIDIVSNKLATECTPERAKKELEYGDAERYSGDTFTGAQAATASEKDDIHKCNDALPVISIDSAPNPCTGSCTFVVSIATGTHPLTSEQFKGTVNILIAGQVVQSYEVSGSGTISFAYTVAVSGTQTVTAEVIDSVLYSGSDSRDVSFGSGGGDEAIELSVSPSGPNKYKFTWNNISDGTPYKLCIDQTPVTESYDCSEESSGVEKTIVGGGKAYVRAKNKTDSAPKTF